MEQLHVEYLEAKLPNITPTKLLKLADDKAQVLKHAGQWRDVDTPAVMALKIALEKQKSDSDTLVRKLVAHVSKLTNQRPYPCQHQPHDPYHPDPNKRPYDNFDRSSRYPTWMMTAPADLNETKVVDRRIYLWCTKCRQNQGLWVNHHNTSTHVNGYHNQQRKLENNRRANLLTTDITAQQEHGTHISTGPPDQDQTPSAQLSIFKYLDSYLPEHDNITTVDTEDP